MNYAKVDPMSLKRVHFIANPKSGKGAGSSLIDEAKKLCAELNYELIVYPITEPNDVDKQSLLAVEAASVDNELIVAAGGDGTIRGVAQNIYGKNVRFGVVACGTFNFFARTHKLPEDPLEALRFALTGDVAPVRLGKVNDHIFLINASLGLYAKSIRERELRTYQFGRNRLIVILSTIATLLSEHFLLSVDMLVGGISKTLLTPMIFIGNNTLQLRDLNMEVAQCMQADQLAVVLMKPVTKSETCRIIVRGIFKTLENSEELTTFCAGDFMIRFRKRVKQMVALDGEIFSIESPLHVQALPDAIQLVKIPAQVEKVS